MTRARRIFTKHGFTLIEILVVIVIIGVLSIMGVSKYTEFTTTSRKSACVANANTLDSTIGVWESQNVAIPITLAAACKFSNNGLIVSSSAGLQALAVAAKNALKTGATSEKVILNYTKDQNCFVCPERANIVGGVQALHGTAENCFEWRLDPTSADVAIGKRMRGTACLSYGDTTVANGPDGTPASLHRQ